MACFSSDTEQHTAVCSDIDTTQTQHTQTQTQHTVALTKSDTHTTKPDTHTQQTAALSSLSNLL